MQRQPQEPMDWRSFLRSPLPPSLSPHALADVGRNYWTPWPLFLPAPAFDLFHVGQIPPPHPVALPLSRPLVLFSARSFLSPGRAPFDGDTVLSLIHKGATFLHPCSFLFCFKVSSLLLMATLNLILIFFPCLFFFSCCGVAMTLMKGGKALFFAVPHIVHKCEGGTPQS